MLILISTFLGIYTKDLKIQNSEEVFFSNIAIKSLQSFENDFTKNEFLIINPDNQKLARELTSLCIEDCFILENGPNQKDNILSFISEDQKILKKIVHTTLSQSPTSNIAGPSFINYLLDRNSEVIGQVVFPIFFVIISLAIFMLFKSVNITISIMAPTILSALLSQAIIKFVFKTSNIIISITPLLVSILTLSAILHVAFQLLKTKNIKKAVKEKFRPIVYMLLSTTLGFFSLSTSPLPVINTFGILTGTLLIICFVISLLLLYLSPFSYKMKEKSFAPQKINFQRYPIKFFITVFMALLIGLPFIKTRIPILIDASSYFSKEDRVKEKLEFITKKTGGAPILDIIIDTDEIKKDVHSFQNIEKELKKSIDNDYISANKLVSIVNQQYAKDTNIPANFNAYLPLYYQVPEKLRELYPLDTKYRISIMGAHISGEKYDKLMKNVDNVLNKTGLKYHYTGQYYWLINAQRGLINTIIKSFSFTLFFISIFVLAIFRNIRTCLIFTYVNIYPVLVVLYLLPITGISINLATVMSFSISLGLMVDSTFHLFFEQRRNANLEDIHQTTILPIFWSNFILGSIFLLFGFISFLPIRQFGLSMSMLIFLGLFFDLYVLPRLLGIQKSPDSSTTT